MPTTSVRPSKLTPKNFLASVYWDSKGLLLFEVLPKNVSLTSDIVNSLTDWSMLLEKKDVDLAKTTFSCKTTPALTQRLSPSISYVNLVSTFFHTHHIPPI